MPKPKKKKKTAEAEMYDHSIDLDVVGLQHRITTSTRRYLARGISEHGPIFCNLVREPENAFDENAIKVVIKEGNYKDLHIGYIQRSVASVLAILLDDGSLEDVLLSVIRINVDAGTADARLQFTAPLKVKTPQMKRKTA